jgi:RNA binding exosome subunit
VKKTFGALHARTLCHATEDLDRVKIALENVLGKSELTVTRTEGHHGNPIIVIETVVEDERIDEFFAKLRIEDVEKILSSLSSRIDEGCNMFIRIDKQAAFKEDIRIGANDDVISLRVRVRSFPAKKDAATSIVKGYLESRLAVSEN